MKKRIRFVSTAAAAMLLLSVCGLDRAMVNAAEDVTEAGVTGSPAESDAAEINVVGDITVESVTEVNTAGTAAAENTAGTAAAENTAGTAAAENTAGDETAENAAGTAAAENAAGDAAAENAAGIVDAASAEGFVSLAEAVPDVILEIRYYSTYNFVGDRIDGYEEPCALLTKEAAEALKGAAQDAKDRGYMLKIYDAYRPQAAVDNFIAWAEDTGDTRMKEYFYPELDKSVLFDQGYIAEKSGHSRGSTLDLTLFDMDTGKDLDMGGTFDYFGERSHPDYIGDLTGEQIANRNALRDIMMQNGFRPLDTEWWHFTLEGEPYPDTYFTFPVEESVVNQ